MINNQIPHKILFDGCLGVGLVTIISMVFLVIFSVILALKSGKGSVKIAVKEMIWSSLSMMILLGFVTLIMSGFNNVACR